MITIANDKYNFASSEIDNAIERWNSHTREDVPVESWEMSIRQEGLKIRGRQDVIPLRSRGMSTLLSRIHMPSIFAGRMPNHVLIPTVNGMLEYEQSKRSVVRICDGEVRAVISGTYGVMEDITILNALNERSDLFSTFLYEVSEGMSVVSLTLVNPIGIDLGNGYTMQCGVSITNSDVTESSLWLLTSATIYHEGRMTGNIRMRRRNDLAARMIHRGKIAENFPGRLEQFLNANEERISLIQDKVESLTKEYSESYIENMEHRSMKMVEEQSSINVVNEYKRIYSTPAKSMLELFTRFLNFKTQVRLSDIGINAMDTVAERILW